MLVKEWYSETIFRKIKELSGGANSIITYYRKGYHCIACIGINLIVVTRPDYHVTSLIYKKQEVKIEFIGDNNQEVNLYLEEVFGPMYINLDGYSVCYFNDEYNYNNLKPLGTIIGHILTNQPFSYKAYLNNIFIEEDN